MKRLSLAFALLAVVVLALAACTGRQLQTLLGAPDQASNVYVGIGANVQVVNEDGKPIDPDKLAKVVNIELRFSGQGTFGQDAAVRGEASRQDTISVSVDAGEVLKEIGALAKTFTPGGAAMGVLEEARALAIADDVDGARKKLEEAKALHKEESSTPEENGGTL